jgi:two-component system, cell cycle sensor histidine kinase and response regulator CckA
MPDARTADAGTGDDRTVEERLIEAQRLATVGLLAGGIAHDFNNVLTVVLTSAMLLRDRLGGQPEALEELQEIEVAARWGAALTRQLLSYGRRKPVQAVVMDLNELTGRTERLLRRLIGEHIELSTALLPGPALIRADPVQVEQVLVNLGLNARDAMPAGGRLRLETTTGRDGWVDVTISDTGHGMAPEVLARLAEPLFTTKAEGRGTGLGLAISYMIVRLNGGRVEVSSEPGKGTVFRLSFPRVESAPPQEQPSSAGAERGSETILLAEDEPAVRAVAARTLRSLGYTVLEAAHGREALELARQHAGPVHLLVSDLVMPHLDGRGLVAELHRERPEVRVLFTTGYPSDVLSGTTRAGAAILSKPYDRQELGRRVRELLDRETRGRARRATCAGR